jgi:uncharacterized protein (TIGR02266 family)
MAERRTVERRVVEKRPPDSQPRRERRGGERRDSPRVPMSFLVRDLAEGGSYQERIGDLSVGGIHWTGKYPPEGAEVEVRFRLPREPREIRARGEIIRLEAEGGGIGFHVRFTHLDVESELAVARYLEQV